jgi:hypothetical protein
LQVISTSYSVLVLEELNSLVGFLSIAIAVCKDDIIYIEKDNNAVFDYAAGFVWNSLEAKSLKCCSEIFLPQHR